MLKAGKWAIVIAFISFSITSCKKDSQDAIMANNTNNNRVAAVEVHLTENGTTDEKIYIGASDSNSMSQDIVLQQGKAYHAVVKYFAQGNNPTNGSSACSFYFEPSAASNIAVVDLNSDNKGVSMGSISTWVTEVKGTGNIKIVVKDDKNTATNAEVVFRTLIK